MARILVAEDDDNVRAFVTRALEMSGHEVIDASDGGLALEIANEHNGNFDLLVSDIKMPVMDGIGLALAASPPRLFRWHARRCERSDDVRFCGQEPVPEGIWMVSSMSDTRCPESLLSVSNNSSTCSSPTTD